VALVGVALLLFMFRKRTKRRLSQQLCEEQLKDYAYNPNTPSPAFNDLVHPYDISD
jgi:hypothetical protein